MPNKTTLAASAGTSRRSLYSAPRQPTKDWHTKQLIGAALREHPGYGHKRLAIYLGINKKRVLRVMKLFGLKPYRRACPKVYKKPKDSVFPNLLLSEEPRGLGDIYVYTREVVGVSVLTTHNTQLVLNALASAVLHRPPPRIIHSDQGSEYTSKDYTALTQKLGIQQSMSAPGCPWENGYQESFCRGFKLDLGDPNRFETLGELVVASY